MGLLFDQASSVGRPGRPRRWAGALLAVVLGTAACRGPDVPEGSVAVDDLVEKGDCIGPDPADANRFAPRSCDDPKATARVIETLTLVLASEVECPAGTDALLDARQGPVHEGGIVGLPETWCLRNLQPPHPGDPGMGGGQLLAEDCFALGSGGNIQEVPCGGVGNQAAGYRLLAVVEVANECPPATTDPIEVNALPPEYLCAVEL